MASLEEEDQLDSKRIGKQGLSGGPFRQGVKQGKSRDCLTYWTVRLRVLGFGTGTAKAMTSEHSAHTPGGKWTAMRAGIQSARGGMYGSLAAGTGSGRDAWLEAQGLKALSENFFFLAMISSFLHF